MNTDATDRLFAERLQVIRNARGLSGKAVAARMGLHERFMHDIERRRRRVSVGEGLALCAVLGVELAQMLDPAVPVETLLGSAE